MTSRCNGKMNPWYAVLALTMLVLWGGQPAAADPFGNPFKDSAKDSAASKDSRLCEEMCPQKLEREAEMMEAMRLQPQYRTPAKMRPSPYPTTIPASQGQPTPEELAEIEWIKSQIGDGNSVAAPLERLEEAHSCTNERPMFINVGSLGCFPSATPPSRVPTPESQMLRKMARELEQSAADLEERGDYELADQLRELAASHWRVARGAGPRHTVISAEGAP